MLASQCQQNFADAHNALEVSGYSTRVVLTTVTSNTRLTYTHILGQSRRKNIGTVRAECPGASLLVKGDSGSSSAAVWNVKRASPLD